MNHPKRFSALTLSLLSSAVAFVAIASPAIGQTKPPTGTGLDSLDEGRVRETLASMGMEDLLTRSFETGHVSQADQDSIRSLISLNRLVNQNTDKLTGKQRKEIVGNVTAGLDKALVNMKDPKALMNLAGKLYAIGVMDKVSLMEYWGEDTATQAEIRAAADAVVKVYTKAEAAANDKMNALANTIQNANDPRLDDLTKLQTLVTTVQYTRVSSQYAVAMSLDAADPKRKATVDASIEALKQYDDPTSTIQPTIKNQLGKLMIAKGDYDGAKAMFKSLYDSNGAVQPAPKPFDLNDARFFSAVADLLAKRPDAAEKQLNDTIVWQRANLTDQDDLKLATAPDEVLKARIAWARAEAAASPADKAKFNDQASTILTALMKSNPGLKPLILEQLVTRLPAGADLKKLDVLLLQSLISRATVEYGKDKKETFDKATIEKGMAAAREIVSRKGQPGVDPEVLTNAVTVIPFFAQKLDQPIGAAAAFLDFAQTQQKDLKKADDAWAQAMNIIVGDFKAPNNTDPEVSALYDRALPLGINPPFNHTDLAYTWARRQQALGNTVEAVKYFKLVPADSPVAVNAKYWLTFALNARLDDPKLSPADKTKIVQEIQTSAEEVSKTARASLATATDEKKKNVYRQMLTGTILLSSRLAQDQQHDAKGALEQLNGFEDAVKGLPNAEALLAEAQQTRVRAYMDSGDSSKATAALVDYMEKRPNEGISLVARLLKQLGNDIDAAEAKHDDATLAALLPQRAALTGFLSKWAKENKDPKVQEQAFAYEAFDATSKRLAAAFEHDPAKRKALLDATLASYESLLAQPKGAADPNVQFGSALTYYELGNYEKSRDLLLKLLRDRRLGRETMEVTVNGQTQLQDNDLYWEARLKLLRSNVEIAKKATDQAAMQATAGELRLIYTQFGKTTGGAKWGPEFEKLRKELDPTINPDDSVVPAATQPATEQSVP